MNNNILIQIKQFFQVTKLYWRLQMYRIHMTKLDCKKLDVLMYMYKTYEYMIKHPEILEVIKESKNYDEKTVDRFMDDFHRMRDLQTIIESFWKEERR